MLDVHCKKQALLNGSNQQRKAWKDIRRIHRIHQMIITTGDLNVHTDTLTHHNANNQRKYLTGCNNFILAHTRLGDPQPWSQETPQAGNCHTEQTCPSFSSKILPSKSTDPSFIISMHQKLQENLLCAKENYWSWPISHKRFKGKGVLTNSSALPHVPAPYLREACVNNLNKVSNLGACVCVCVCVCRAQARQIQNSRWSLGHVKANSKNFIKRPKVQHNAHLCTTAYSTTYFISQCTT